MLPDIDRYIDRILFKGSGGGGGGRWALATPSALGTL